MAVIIPARNEAAAINGTVAAVRAAPGVKVWVADGGSQDGTPELAAAAGARVLVTAPGRGRQMNAAARQAEAELLFFLHADTMPPPGFDRAIRETLAGAGVAAGAFRLGIAGQGAGLRLVARVANARSRWLGLPYGDQGLFLRAKDFWAAGGFPEVPLMEDLMLVRRLRRRGRIVIRPEAVLTSGRRWQSLGLWRTTCINQLMLAGFYGGIDLGVLARLYRGRPEVEQEKDP